MDFGARQGFGDIWHPAPYKTVYHVYSDSREHWAPGTYLYTSHEVDQYVRALNLDLCVYGDFGHNSHNGCKSKLALQAELYRATTHSEYLKSLNM